MLDHPVFYDFLFILIPDTTKGKFVFTNTMLQLQHGQETTPGKMIKHVNKGIKCYVSYFLLRSLLSLGNTPLFVLGIKINKQFKKTMQWSSNIFCDCISGYCSNLYVIKIILDRYK